MNWLCVQDGAREHYAIPRALHRVERLELLFTELWCGPLRQRLALGPLRSLATRFHLELANAQVVDWTWQKVVREVFAKAECGVRYPKVHSPYHGFIQDGKWFSERVREYLEQHGSDVRGKVIFSYDTTALELFRWAKERGAICILGQIDPGRMEVEMVQAEEQRWPGWARNPISVPEEYFQRREAEWQLAHRIVVNSKWSAKALEKQGVPPGKLLVIPLAYEAENERQSEAEGEMHFSKTRPLRILWLGQVNLRKGIPYLVAAASLLSDAPVHFDVVGPIGISDAAMKSASLNMSFHGRAGRDETSEWYARNDVFVLPTISDGFAITQIEAMSHGLPVIATPNCGAVVTDGADGFIVPAGDPAALAQCIRNYLKHKNLLPLQRVAALEKSKQFSLDQLESRLMALSEELNNHFSCSPPHP